MAKSSVVLVLMLLSGACDANDQRTSGATVPGTTVASAALPVCGDDEGFGYQELVDAWRRGASINKGGLLTLDSNAEYGDGGDVPGIVCHDHATQLPLSLPEGWELDWS